MNGEYVISINRGNIDSDRLSYSEENGALGRIGPSYEDKEDISFKNLQGDF